MPGNVRGGVGYGVGMNPDLFTFLNDKLQLNSF